MAIALAQSIPTIASSGAATTLASTAFGSSPTVGNYITAWAWGWSSAGTGTGAFTDTGGTNVWTTYFQEVSGNLWVLTGWAKVAASGASFKTTWTKGAGRISGSANVIQAEWSGVAATSPLDGTPVGATGTGVTVAPGNLTVTAGSLVVALGSDNNTSFLGSTPSGFTRAGFQNDGNANQAGEAIYRIGGASPSNPSRTITSALWAAQQFALLASTSATTWGYENTFPPRAANDGKFWVPY